MHLSDESLLPVIRTVRGRRVILDADLARIYGVRTKALNQAAALPPFRREDGP